MTKKRKAKIQQRKEVVILLAIMISAAIIGHAGQKDALKIAYSAPEAQKTITTHLPANLAKEPLNGLKIIALKSNHPEAETQANEIARKLCAKKNLGDYCQKDLVAILNNETRFNFKVFADGKCIPQGYSDGGLAMGCYQIHKTFHPEVKKEQAENLEWSMGYALNLLIGHGYPEYRSLAIRSYNGAPDNPKTLAYLKNINEFIK